MKKQFLIFILLIITYTTAQAEFVEQFRSEPKRRFAKALKNVLASDEYSTRDLNGNGVNDRVQFMVNGQSGGYLCSIYDGLSKSPYQQFPIANLGDTGTHEVGHWIGFYLKGDNPPTLVLSAKTGDVAMEEIYLIDVMTGQVEFSAANAKFLGVANVDNDFVPELLYFDMDISFHEFVIIEWKEGGNGGVSNSALLNTKNQSSPHFTKSNLDYSLTLKYESAPKTQLVYDDSFFESASDLDADGDGVMDIVLAIENDNNDLIGIVVRDGATKEIKWAFQYPEGQLSEFSNFRGFYDVDGNGVKEAFFGNRTVVTVDKTVNSLNANFELQAVYDVDSDGYPDLIGIGLQDSTVQVWGIESPSGIGEKDLIAAGFQLRQNYPNPFNPSTTISWQSPVSGHQVLKVFDVLGNEIATLVDEYKSAGNYEVELDASQLASGVYIYKLTSGSFVETKKMVLLR
jgi:hypothetical protein